jgi:hypothetical protein
MFLQSNGFCACSVAYNTLARYGLLADSACGTSFPYLGSGWTNAVYRLTNTLLLCMAGFVLLFMAFLLVSH